MTTKKTTPAGWNLTGAETPYDTHPHITSLSQKLQQLFAAADGIQDRINSAQLALQEIYCGGAV